MELSSFFLNYYLILADSNANKVLHICYTVELLFAKMLLLSLFTLLDTGRFPTLRTTLGLCALRNRKTTVKNIYNVH